MTTKLALLAESQQEQYFTSIESSRRSQNCGTPSLLMLLFFGPLFFHEL